MYIKPHFENDSLYPRRDELMIQWLWEAIVESFNRIMQGTFGSIYEEGKAFNHQPALLHVIIGSGVYWANQFVTDDEETIDAAIAFLALRGNTDLIYSSQEYYDQKHSDNEPEPFNTDDTDGLGNLDAHPF